MPDQFELAFADDYEESFEPLLPCCGLCTHCDEGRPWRGWKVPSYCAVVGHEVSRSTGRCGKILVEE